MEKGVLGVPATSVRRASPKHRKRKTGNQKGALQAGGKCALGLISKIVREPPVQRQEAGSLS